MAGFIIRNDDRNKGSTALPISSIAVAVGDMLEWIPGEAATWTLVTTSTLATTRKAIATQSATTSATEVQGVILDGTELVEATSTNVSAAADNGNLMIIGTATTGAQVINNTGTTVAVTTKEALFQQSGVIGAAADKRILGYVSVGNGTSYAAT